MLDILGLYSDAGPPWYGPMLPAIITLFPVFDRADSACEIASEIYCSASDLEHFNLSIINGGLVLYVFVIIISAPAFIKFSCAKIMIFLRLKLFHHTLNNNLRRVSGGN